MFLTAILALTLAQAAPAHPPRPPDTDQTVPVQRGGRLTINNFAGDVVIHTWSSDSLHVVARHQSRTKVNIRPTAAGMTVSASGSMGPAGSVDYDITAPAWMPIKVEGQFNFITIDGAQAEVSADSVRGDINIKGGTGFVTAKTIEGEIVVEGARGKVNVSSVNQGIKISDTSGDITAESVNGPIALTGIQSSSVEVSTTNGNITYEGTLSDGGRYTMTTHNGDLRDERAGKRQRDLYRPDLQRGVSNRPAAGGAHPARRDAPRQASDDDARQGKRRCDARILWRHDSFAKGSGCPSAGPRIDRVRLWSAVVRNPPEGCQRSLVSTRTEDEAPETQDRGLTRGYGTGDERPSAGCFQGGSGPPPRRVPAGGQQRGLKVLRPPDERERIREQLDVLTAIRMGNHQLVGVTVGLVANLVVQA